MVKIRIADQQKITDSPKGEVGEIDTRPPFQSVKAAVTLFAEVAKDQDKANPKKSKLSENELNKETQLVLVQREIEKYKFQLEASETTKARVSSELEKAKLTLNELATNLKSANESKLSAIEVAEAVKQQVKQLLEVAKSQPQFGNTARKQELDDEREKYMIIVAQLDVAKQELTKLRQDFDAALDAKAASFQQAAEAQRLANLNAERVDSLVKEIESMQESNRQIQSASAQAQEQAEDVSVVPEKDEYIEACKARKEEVDKKLESLRQENNAEMNRNLQVKLVETTVGIETLQEEMRKAHALEMSAVKFITTELNEATKILQEIVEQEGMLRNIVSTLNHELEQFKKQKNEFYMKELALEELEQRSNLEKLIAETETARREIEEINKDCDQLKQETEKCRKKAEEGKKKLEIVDGMVEQAQERERRGMDEMRMLSEKIKKENQDSDKIRMTIEEFEMLKKKVVECDNVAEAKETAATNEVKRSEERRKVAEEKIEENLKAIEEIDEATEIALRSAEMAEAAQSVVEGELRRWRHKEPLVIPMSP
ncbi:WEB family protein At1g12150 [Mercurialis annua]|uniref:WEB family protein At1g12150 n=1 Tax=Mercurialis annua TaxID=3986 RepID=UPI00215EFE19|nr:WEB family protein At1g12150 [Mercurialis annua]